MTTQQARSHRLAAPPSIRCMHAQRKPISVGICSRAPRRKRIADMEGPSTAYGRSCSWPPGGHYVSAPNLGYEPRAFFFFFRSGEEGLRALAQAAGLREHCSFPWSATFCAFWREERFSGVGKKGQLVHASMSIFPFPCKERFCLLGLSLSLTVAQPS